MAAIRQPRRRDVLNATMLASAALLTAAAAPDLPTPEAPADIWASSYWATKRRDGQEIRLVP
jgi:hypothetical protein